MLCKVVPTTEEALTARLLQSTIQTLEVYGVYLGKALGLYAALQADGPLSPPELAVRAGIAPRYAREWLEQQAVAGFLEAETSSGLPDDRRYSLPAAHTNVLVTEDHPAHLAPLTQMVAGIASALDRVVTAYRTGAGVAYRHYGPAFRAGQAGINRPAFLSDLVTRWIPAAPELHEMLLSRPTRIADVGCGVGWAAVAVAQAFPLADVIGFDADPASVSDATRLAAGRSVSVRFEIRDAAALADRGPFDLVLVLEALHDMARPDEALRAIRAALAPGGSVLVAEERVADHFHAPADELERLMCGWSIVHCLPVAMADSPSIAIGTVMRADALRSLATAAGLPRVEVVPVDGGFFRLYRERDESGCQDEVVASSQHRSNLRQASAPSRGTRLRSGSPPGRFG
jgi:SAM-dependent methyltransferase